MASPLEQQSNIQNLRRVSTNFLIIMKNAPILSVISFLSNLKTIFAIKLALTPNILWNLKMAGPPSPPS